MIDVSESITELPDSWVWTRIGDIYDLVGGGTPSTKKEEYWGGDIPWITSADIHGINEIIPRRNVSKMGIDNSSTKIVPDGSLLVVTRVGLGKLALTKEEICVNQDIQALIGNKSLINPDYSLYYLLKAVQIFKYRNRGTTISGVTKKQLSDLEFPLPPFDEQILIANKLEELFTNIDAGIHELTLAKEKLKIYRQSVLKHAFEGKLTEKWREEHGNEFVPGKVVLKSIIKEKKKLKKNYINPPSMNESELGYIPDSWVWTRVGDIYDIVGGGTPSTKKEEYWEGDIPWITSADIYGINEIIPRRYVSKTGIDNSSTKIVPAGSLLIVTRVGLGKLALTKEKICLNQDIQALIGNNLFINPDYSLYYLLKAVQIFKYRNRGTTISGVTKKQLSDLEFPLTSVEEQIKIFEEIEARFSLIDNINSIIADNLLISRKLRQSILNKAFIGQLVPQDPDDEPAEILLERIKAEKEKQKPKRKTRKKSKSKQKRLL